MISIHALLAESDARRAVMVSTRPMDFYPRSPCGERPCIVAGPVLYCSCISIHALLAESDTRNSITLPVLFDFYPRSPCGERPLAPEQNTTKQRISIHALLAESDALIRYLINTYHHFYPRSPCGERLRQSKEKPRQTNFYPRSPCGERPIRIT